MFERAVRTRWVVGSNTGPGAAASFLVQLLQLVLDVDGIIPFGAAAFCHEGRRPAGIKLGVAGRGGAARGDAGRCGVAIRPTQAEATTVGTENFGS